MIKSHISNKNISTNEATKGNSISLRLFSFIQSLHPDFTYESYLSFDELNSFRRIYVANLIENEENEIKMINQEVLNTFKENTILSEKTQFDISPKLTMGQVFADKIASFGGSWRFIFLFFSFFIVWVVSNIWFLSSKAFDPYPFILLNLILSCLAAIQAPIIMMSQNRQEEKDRERAKKDYEINLKAELEIKLMANKIDHLLINQNKKLMEIQQVQIDYLQDLTHKLNQKK